MLECTGFAGHVEKTYNEVKGRVRDYYREGNCYDNACAESFFATIKKELIHRRRFLTRAKAALAIVDYVCRGTTPGVFTVRWEI